MATCSGEESEKLATTSTTTTESFDSGHKRRRVNGKVLAELKRKKWEAKQQAKKAAVSSSVSEKIAHQDQDNIDLSSGCIHLSQRDVDQLSDQSISQDTEISSSSSSWILELLKPYCNLKTEGMSGTIDGTNDNNNHSRSRFFIAESSEAVRLLLKHAPERSINILSILTKPSVFYEKPVHLREAIVEYRKRKPDDDSDNLANNLKVLVAPTPNLLTQIVGYPVQRGCLACGIVPLSYTEEWLEGLVCGAGQDAKSYHPLQLLALDGICDTANMGSILRTAACFGIDAVILSPDCCNPWYRRSIRVSMGHIFGIKLVRVADLASTLTRLIRAATNGDIIRTYAAVLDADATPLDQLLKTKLSRQTMIEEDLDESTVKKKSWCCVLGNEGNGISKRVVDACTDKVQIDMEDGVDSLSVAVAAGILLHAFATAVNTTSKKKREKKG